ncbi:ragulator complex protein LAMTOR2-like [Oscarella lobularis]|uniref:ragulator complex protein LAMTOR2-like n=1 Tax=Oscarella lobularis TaxID=121494 RepID=UPI0033133E0A
MLKPRALAQVLAQANTGGILSTMLLNNEGTLLAYSKSDEDDREAKVTAAIASNIWAAYERIGKTAFQDENLNFLLVNCREGKVGISRVANQLLCIYAHRDVAIGILKAKADALAKYLEEPLTQVALAAS